MKVFRDHGIDSFSLTSCRVFVFATGSRRLTLCGYLVGPDRSLWNGPVPSVPSTGPRPTEGDPVNS
jgi:hypothetical protein